MTKETITTIKYPLPELTERNELIYKLYEDEFTLDAIAANSKVQRLSNGIKLTRQRVQQIIAKQKKKRGGVSK